MAILEELVEVVGDLGADAQRRLLQFAVRLREEERRPVVVDDEWEDQTERVPVDLLPSSDVLEP